jgi:hypothetical protein
VESSWVAIFSAVVAGIALSVNAHAVWRNNQKIELDLFDRIHSKITDLERRLSTFNPEKTTEEVLAHWRGDLLNALEYAAFLFNHGYIGDKRLLEFWEESIIDWYERFFVPYTSDLDRANPNLPYKELKKLYAEIKNRTSVSEG